MQRCIVGANYANSSSSDANSYSSDSDDSDYIVTGETEDGCYTVIPKYENLSHADYDKCHPIKGITDVQNIGNPYKKFEEIYTGDCLQDFEDFYYMFELHARTYFQNDDWMWLTEFKNSLLPHKVMGQLIEGLTISKINYSEFRYIIADYYQIRGKRGTNKSAKKIYKESKMQEGQFPLVYACILEHRYKLAYPGKVNTTAMQEELKDKYIKSVPKLFGLNLEQRRLFRKIDYDAVATWPQFKSLLESCYAVVKNRIEWPSTQTDVKQEQASSHRSSGQRNINHFNQQRRGNSNSYRGGRGRGNNNSYYSTNRSH